MFLGISYIASISAYILTCLAKANVVFDMWSVAYEGVMIFSGFYITNLANIEPSKVLSRNCQRGMDLSAEAIASLDTVYELQVPGDKLVSF